MFCIYFPGYSTKNLDELESISNHLEKQGHEVWARRWDHWTNPDIAWEPDRYAQEAAEQLSNKDGFVLIAKSLGTHVGMRLLSKLASKDFIKKVILLGIPLNDLNEEEKQDYLRQIPTVMDKLAIVQNELDDHGTAQQVKGLLSEFEIEIIVKPGVDNHRYNYPEDIALLVGD